ncbi:uncharacterized protein LOC120654781 [Panicum virgatum]|uniref:uncharacterized protein LOC120654781 n=1 Tax=Panicum virgatum TaxID=38727 RepID=UPI0019D50D8D|nr:uncharacterized protein LOC120654781 [Panicum virgatum]
MAGPSSLTSEARRKADTDAQAARDAEAQKQADARAARQAAHDAALERARLAEEEAAAASEERDDADARVRAALDHAALERKAAADPDDDDIDSASEVSVPGDAGGDLHDALLIHEVAALLNLHTQAVAVQNIKSLVPVVLDINSSSYSRWREQFLLTLGRYQLQDHVLQDRLARLSPDWTLMDCVVRSWLYGTLSNDLVLSKSAHGSTARTTWLAIEAQFLGNKEVRALHLDARFRTFVQGDLSITDYCKVFKRMADDLADLGEPVTDRTLVLNVLRGLNEKFASIGRHLRRGRPFPSFLEVCDDLILEEITLAEKASTPSSALLAGTSSTPSASPPQRKGGRGKHGKATKGGGPPQPATGGGGSSSHNSTAPTQAANAQWPSFYNP